ncbi:MAG: DUF6446 family protein [Paracoccaceae bacterium]
MNGELLIGGFLVFTAVFAAALVCCRSCAWYRTVEDLPFIAVKGVSLPVRAYRGIDADGWPLKLRGCFGIDPDKLPDTPAAGATPVVAPGWFDCFDARKIETGLKSGNARAVLAARDDPEGFDRYPAIYPGSRAFMWRQLNEKYVN